MTNLQLIETHNLYPDCISLELETIVSETKTIDLYLTVKFGEQWESLLGGRLKFGLKGGELKLTLSNCTFSQNYPISSDNLSVDIAPDYLSYYFTGKEKTVLNSSLNKVKLGTINITDNPCSIEATFNLSLANISLTDAEGLWKHDITPNKHGVLDRKLASFLLENLCQPYISYATIGSENLQSNYNIPEKNTDNKLQEIINQIIIANTNNLLELADLAGLNPSQDFAGANFLGTDLSGLDLSGCNLEYINLRGAVITDTDLSDANLSRAKLSGADLSGAFLENANLSFADFHCASLALVNLIGANLTGAILTETNLTNANFSSAILENTIFANNQGISDTFKATLLARGAKIQS
jgi:uncharacterized protein YjbI with pentapeptide repeats